LRILVLDTIYVVSYLFIFGSCFAVYFDEIKIYIYFDLGGKQWQTTSLCELPGKRQWFIVVTKGRSRPDGTFHAVIMLLNECSCYVVMLLNVCCYVIK